MGAMKEVVVPDIGDFKQVDVVEILVKPGDTVQAEQSLVTLESDKATMEIPSPSTGVVKEVRVKIGDKVSEGSPILRLESAEAAAAKAAGSSKAPAAAPAPAAVPAPAPARSVRQINVPDIGDFKEVEVIEILVKPGDTVSAEQSLITLESDKATMEVPSPAAGRVKEVIVKVGDQVAQGTPILALEEDGGASAADVAPARAPAPQPHAQPQTAAPAAPAPVRPPPTQHASPAEATGAKPHASPSVRKFARELGVDLGKVKGSGPKNRILIADIQGHVKGVMAYGPAPSGGETGAGLGLLPWPQVDFTKFGPIESQPLSRIKKISGANLHRNWVMIPHVTNHDEADITELEAFRVQLNKEHEKTGIRVTMLAFLVKACVAALKKFPEVNSSLDGDNLVLKRYYHIGFAADTPNGLVVPVIKEADKKGVLDIARETSELAKQARDAKLKPADMQGGTFSISSLGGIGGTAFSPIINAPEVAILGVSRSAMKPVWDGKQFAPRLILPLSLSYDHRVIDGAAGARFNAYLGQLLGDFRRAML
jgi:pyruvate dehydrogenase E2 component (dihydrolipoamide acetyltransferase)